MKKMELWNLAEHGTVENSIVKYLQFLNGVEKGKGDLKDFAEAFTLKKHEQADQSTLKGKLMSKIKVNKKKNYH